MPNRLAVKSVLEHSDGTTQDVVHFFCPGCEQMHHVGVGGSAAAGLPNWEWNGRLDEGLTVSPSILAFGSVHICKDEHGPVPCPDPETCDHVGHGYLDYPNDMTLTTNTPHTKDPAWGNCHSFLRDGVWDFLSDSAHALAGQQVPMIPIPDWAEERWS